MLAQHDRMVNELRRLDSQRPGGGHVQRHVRQVIVAADHVGDAEVGVVDHARPVIGGAAVGAQDHKRRHTLAAQLDGAVADAGAGGLSGGFAVAIEALALAHRALVPAETEPTQIVQDSRLEVGA